MHPQTIICLTDADFLPTLVGEQYYMNSCFLRQYSQDIIKENFLTSSGHTSCIGRLGVKYVTFVCIYDFIDIALRTAVYILNIRAQTQNITMVKYEYNVDFENFIIYYSFMVFSMTDFVKHKGYFGLLGLLLTQIQIIPL